MSKIHEIEKCMRCGVLIRTLISSNHKELNELKENIEEAIENPTKGEGSCLSLFTSLGVSHNEADITYFLCAQCCMDIVVHLMRRAITDREILFRNFDDLRKELKA